MVKGLAKLWNRLRHGLWTKYVDASPFMDEGRLLPNDGQHYNISVYQVHDNGRVGVRMHSVQALHVAISVLLGFQSSSASAFAS
jgi:hypothetical protein